MKFIFKSFVIKRTLYLLLFFIVFSFAHPYYLGVCELKYNMKSETVQASVKLFVNDLEATLKKKNHSTIDLINSKDSTKTAQLLFDYLSNHLKVKLNGTAKTFQYIGFEIDKDVIWIYLESNKCDKPKRIEIENTILYDFSKHQTNIVKIDVNEKSQNSKLTYPDKNLVFVF